MTFAIPTPRTLAILLARRMLAHLFVSSSYSSSITATRCFALSDPVVRINRVM